MKFCPDCENHMSKTTSTGIVQFYCACGNTLAGAPTDTLMAEEYFEAATSDAKYETFITNSPHDQGGYKVAKKCPNNKCNLPFMTLLRLSSRENLIYTCLCGGKYTEAEWKQATERASAKKST